MKKIIPLLFIIPTLLACSDNTYKGAKIKLEYVEEGALLEVEAKHMFDEAFANKVDSIYLIADDSCKACQSLKTYLTFWCKDNHANVYEIVYSKVDEESLNYIIDSTVGYYAWTKESTVPTTYFFMQGVVAMTGDNETTGKLLDKYVEVVKS